MFVKGPNKNQRCHTKPQKGSEYCGKHKKCGHGAKTPKEPKPIPEPEARAAVTVMQVASGEVGEAQEVPGDVKVVEEVPWFDVNAGYYAGDFWDERHHYPPIDASGSDSCVWSPPVCNY